MFADIRTMFFVAKSNDSNHLVRSRGLLGMLKFNEFISFDDETVVMRRLPKAKARPLLGDRVLLRGAVDVLDSPIRNDGR